MMVHQQEKTPQNITLTDAGNNSVGTPADNSDDCQTASKQEVTESGIVNDSDQDAAATLCNVTRTRKATNTCAAGDQCQMKGMPMKSFHCHFFCKKKFHGAECAGTGQHDGVQMDCLKCFPNMPSPRKWSSRRLLDRNCRTLLTKKKRK